jgi:hypothetical protein
MDPRTTLNITIISKRYRITLAEREGHSATFVLSACFPEKISKSGSLEGYIADYKVDYILRLSSTGQPICPRWRGWLPSASSACKSSLIRRPNGRHNPRPSDRNLDVPELAAALPKLMSEAANGPVAPPEVAGRKYAHGKARPLNRYKRYARD